MMMQGSDVEVSTESAQFQTMTKVGVLGNLKKLKQFFPQKSPFLKLDSGGVATVEPPIELTTQGTEEVDVVELY